MSWWRPDPREPAEPWLVPPVIEADGVRLRPWREEDGPRLVEAANDPVLVADNPLFGPSPANPSGFAYPATRSFANMPEREAGDPRPAPYLGEHSEEVLAERLGMTSGEIARLIDAGVVATSDKDRK